MIETLEKAKTDEDFEIIITDDKNLLGGGDIREVGNKMYITEEAATLMCMCQEHPDLLEGLNAKKRATKQKTKARKKRPKTFGKNKK